VPLRTKSLPKKMPFRRKFPTEQKEKLKKKKPPPKKKKKKKKKKKENTPGSNVKTGRIRIDIIRSANPIAGILETHAMEVEARNRRDPPSAAMLLRPSPGSQQHLLFKGHLPNHRRRFCVGMFPPATAAARRRVHGLAVAKEVAIVLDDDGGTHRRGNENQRGEKKSIDVRKKTACC
jgi:hypothetical protein